MQNVPQQIQSLVLTTEGKNIGQGNLGEILKVENIKLPQLQRNEVLVQVRAVALGPSDVETLMYQEKSSTPGFDMAGVVVKSEGGKFKEGDRVAGMVTGGLAGTLTDSKARERFKNNGSFANYVISNADFLCMIPQNLSFEQAASTPFTALSAYQAFGFQNWPHREQSHTPVLIVSGGMIGLDAIQIGHLTGYKVLVACRPDQQDLATRYGADQVFSLDDQKTYERIREVTQNQLNFAIHADGDMQTLKVAAMSLGKNGGTIGCIVPGEHVSGPQEMRSDVKITVVNHLPTTLFGYEGKWDNKVYKPHANEAKNTQAFLQTLHEWMRDDKWRGLPIEKISQEGLQGIPDALQKIRASGPPTARMVTLIQQQNQ